MESSDDRAAVERRLPLKNHSQTNGDDLWKLVVAVTSQFTAKKPPSAMLLVGNTDIKGFAIGSKYLEEINIESSYYRALGRSVKVP